MPNTGKYYSEDNPFSPNPSPEIHQRENTGMKGMGSEQ